jgi:hypothetical protein
MKKIIDPVAVNELEKELNENTFIRKTNYSNHDIYIVDYHNQPNTTLEIGRLREMSFRNAGGGTGKSFDLDEYDQREEDYYKQLLVWDPDEKQIIGGYRFLLGVDILKSKKYSKTATNKLFKFNKEFSNKIFPKTIELGRSFVQPAYQPSSGNRKSIFSLDNLWDGLGALVVNYPKVEYFFGKVTMYLDFNKKGRDLILGFINHFFPNKENWINAKYPLKYHHDIGYFVKEIKGLDYETAYKVLLKKLKELESPIPPLIAAYMNLSSTMRSFGTAINNNFGEVEETGILISIKDIYPEKKNRHINSYLEQLKKL